MKIQFGPSYNKTPSWLSELIRVIISLISLVSLLPLHQTLSPHKLLTYNPFSSLPFQLLSISTELSRLLLCVKWWVIIFFLNYLSICERVKKKRRVSKSNTESFHLVGSRPRCSQLLELGRGLKLRTRRSSQSSLTATGAQSLECSPATSKGVHEQEVVSGEEHAHRGCRCPRRHLNHYTKHLPTYLLSFYSGFLLKHSWILCKYELCHFKRFLCRNIKL